MSDTPRQRQRVRKQHVVPQCYLKRFTSDGHRLFYFHKATGRTGTTGISQAAQHEYFYDIPQHLARAGIDQEQPVEQRLSERERIMNTLLDALLATVETNGITPDKREAISYYILLQASRTATVRQRMAGLFANCGGGIKKLIERENYTGPMPDLSALENFRTEDVPLWHGHLLMNFTDMWNRSEALSSLIAYIGINDTPELLYTSDVPAQILRPLPLPLLLGSGAFGEGPLVVLYPLTPRRILVLCDRQCYPDVAQFDNATRNIDLETVRSFNLQQVANSHQYVYSQTADFSTAIAVREYLANPSRL